MLCTRMDLLNSQFLDKMNNNIGRLHYDGKVALLFLFIWHFISVYVTSTLLLLLRPPIGK